MVVPQEMKKQLSQAQSAEMIDHNKRWSTTALLGRMTLTETQARAVGAALDLPEEVIMLLQATLYKGSLPTSVPMDPLICCFYELISVYDTTSEALIHEEFGNGIMSAIDFNTDFTRESDPEDDRVRVVMSGKFPPYKTY